MTYRAPVEDIVFTMRHVAGLDRAVGGWALWRPLRRPGRGDAGGGRPLRQRRDRAAQPRGDKHGAREGRRRDHPAGLEGGLQAWAEAGWNALPGPEEYGGQGLPMLLNSACIEMWNAASHGLRHRARCSPWAPSRRSTARQRRAEAAAISPSWSPASGRHDEPHRAAGGLRPRRPAHARRAAPATAPTASPARRSSSPTASTTSPTTSSISCWRACPTRRRARAASRCSSCRSSSSTRRLLGRATTCAAARIEHKLGIHASPTCAMIYRRRGRRRSASWSARRTAASPACSR